MSQNKQLPRDVLVIQGLLKEMGVASYEPKIVNQMLEFIYRYVTSVVEEARVYSSYAKKKLVDIDDVKLAIKMISDKSYSTVPPRDMLLSIAKQKNSTPLPLLKSGSGLRLPPDRYCLTQPNYQLQFYKRAIASSSSQAPTNVRTQGSANVFKTPNVPPKISSVGASSSSSAAAGTPTFRILSASEASNSGGTPPPIIQYTAGSTATGTPMMRMVSQSGVISTGVKRKLSDDLDDSAGGM